MITMILFKIKSWGKKDVTIELNESYLIADAIIEFGCLLYLILSL